MNFDFSFLYLESDFHELVNYPCINYIHIIDTAPNNSKVLFQGATLKTKGPIQTTFTNY